MSLPRWSRALAVAALLGVSTLARPGGTSRRPRVPRRCGGPSTRPSRSSPPRCSAGRHRRSARRRRSTGVAVAALDERRAFNPASNAKLLTAAAALRVLGGHHRFLTGLYGRIDSDSVDELVLRGDGDPSLRTPDLWAMAGELRAAACAGALDRVDQASSTSASCRPRSSSSRGEGPPFRAPVAGGLAQREHGALLGARRQEGVDAVVDVDPPRGSSHQRSPSPDRPGGGSPRPGGDPNPGGSRRRPASTPSLAARTEKSTVFSLSETAAPRPERRPLARLLLERGRHEALVEEALIHGDSSAPGARPPPAARRPWPRGRACAATESPSPRSTSSSTLSPVDAPVEDR